MKHRSLMYCGAALGLLLAVQCGQLSATPLRAQAAASGDLNGDGAFNAADVSLLQGWLLNKGTALSDWRAADFDGNRTLNAIDLSLMKQSVPEVEPDPVYVHLRDSGITFEGGTINVSGKTAEITKSGVYVIDGSINGGQILVNIPDESADAGTVKLYLKGVEISNDNAPCIMVENAEKTSVNLEDGTVNKLTDRKDAPNEEIEPEFAVLHAKDDLTIKGGGTLEITAGVAYGIHCNNDLKLNGGTLNITTENGDAVRGKTSVTVKDGNIWIDTEGDGIKSTKGTLDIVGGTVQIKSGKDALQSETEMNLTGGTVQACGDRGITAGTFLNTDGCTLLATATDNQCENLGSSNNAIALSLTKEWAKNNPIAVTNGSNTLMELNTFKKFSYAVVASPELSGTYSVYTGGIQVLQNGQDGFRTGNAYTDVNNTMEAKLLYAGLFDQSRVHKIDVQMTDSNWNTLLSNSNQQKEEYIPCDIVIDGEQFYNAAIRAKGNSSLMMVAQGSVKKFSWRIKLDKYDKYQNYHGLTEFCMNNMYSDPSCMRDMLCYNALYEVEGIGPNCSYTDMYLNGKLYSFYFLAEQPGDTLAERLATTTDSVLYKATDKAGGGGGGGWFGGGGGNGGYCSFTSNMPLDNFDVKFGEDNGYAHIAAVKDAINRVSPSNYKFIEDVIDVPSFLKGFAVNSVMCNYDSYNGTLAHNYYLMYSGGKCYFVGWDYNLALGNFMDYGASVNSDVTTSLYQVEVNDRPLVKLLQVDEYNRMYTDYVKKIVNMYSNPEQVVNGYASLIRDHVKADPNSFFTPDKFESNISKSANGLQVGGGGGGGGGWGWPGGGGWGWPGGGGGGAFFGGDQVSIVDFIIKRNEIVRQAMHF